MLIYDDIFTWTGWGIKTRRSNGRCRLRIYDLRQKNLVQLRPFMVVLEDVDDSDMSVMSWAGHIATRVAREFDLDPLRTLWIQHFPACTYGKDNLQTIPEKYELIEFTWYAAKALQPRGRPLGPDLSETVNKQLVLRTSGR